MSNGIDQLVGMARMKATIENVQRGDVTRFAGVNSDYPLRFRHTLNTFTFGGGPVASIRELLAYWSIVKRGLRISTGGASAQWGDGAYAWPADHAVGNRAYIDFEVPTGTLIEELHVPRQGIFYRLLPHAGHYIAIRLLGTNIPNEQLDQYKNF